MTSRGCRQFSRKRYHRGSRSRLAYHRGLSAEISGFPGDLPTGLRQVFVDEDPGALQLPSVPHDGLLDVVCREADDNVPRRRAIFGLTVCSQFLDDLVGHLIRPLRDSVAR